MCTVFINSIEIFCTYFRIVQLNYVCFLKGDKNDNKTYHRFTPVVDLLQATSQAEMLFFTFMYHSLCFFECISNLPIETLL